MGSESSQIEKPTASQLPEVQEDEHSDEADTDALSVAGSNKTSGTNNTSASRALARDLENSVLQSSLDREQRRKRKRKSVESQPSATEDPPDPAISPAQNSAAQQDTEEEDEDMASNDNSSVNDTPRSERDTERKHLLRELHRMKKTVLVNSGRAKWAPRINGAKWEVEKLPPGQWSKREVSNEEEATLKKYKAKVKDLKKRLKAFDRAADAEVDGREVEHNQPMSEDEIALPSDHALVPASKQVLTDDEPIHTQDPAQASLSKVDRKRQRREHPKPRSEAEAEIQVEEDEQMAEAPSKKRKRPQPQAITSSPPRPSAAAERKPVLRSVAGKHKTELVKSWLSSQGPQDDMDGASEHSDPDVPEPSRKRKRTSKDPEEDDDEFQAASEDQDGRSADSDDDLPTFKPVTVPSKKARGPKSSKSTVRSKQRAPSEESHAAREMPAMSTGPFTADEKSLADSVFNQVLLSEGIDEATLKQNISNWRSAGTFKEEIEAAFPAREKASLRKFCQRRYHMQERGPWTAEQDEDLRNAQANYPDQWRKLQDIVGRTAADCKDRWTMHLSHSKRTGAWSQDEECKLVAAVENAMETIKNDAKTDPEVAADRVALEDAVHWKWIAKELGNTRNPKQCREKWQNLKRRETRESTKHDGTSRGPAKVRASTAKKLNAVRKKVRSFEIGDFYDIFVEIHTAFDDTSERFQDEDSVLWSIVAQKNMGSRFSLSSMGGALRRVALEHALKEWNVDSKKIRRRLESSEALPAKAKVLAKLLEKSYAGRLHAMSRTFMPEMIGMSKADILQFKAEKKKALAEKMKERAIAAKRVRVKSQAFVNDMEDTDEDGDDPDGVHLRTPAIDDDEGSEEEDIGDDDSEEDQSVCQRRLDAQLNGRQEDRGEENEGSDLPGVTSIPKSENPGSFPDAGQDSEPESDARDALLKQESVSDESEDVQSWGPADPNDPHDAEMLRRFDAAIKEMEQPAPPVYDSTDDDEDAKDLVYDSDDDDDAGREAVESLAGRYPAYPAYAVSSHGVETPVVNRDNFIRKCRE